MHTLILLLRQYQKVKLTAYKDIDRVIHAVERYKRPGYIELPSDMVNVVRSHKHRDLSLAELTDTAVLQECIAEATMMLNQSRRPVILAGVEIHRFDYWFFRFKSPFEHPVTCTYFHISTCSIIYI
jgi:TPP-dependent 2-oxoacid decarboxylase